ncbi:murein biosynthesis integral membrane protein MurJ [Aurantiacibacter gangjinensis]|uniref:Probable lipid II flippase MurJ n=1 Tax=Aurantiacibacter gangjinensis TaxID=502682 RepID=A0A0G9MPE5_9SPHN|nr:murein biosynthesis integral membrane protein MurJ [Aurantiacibacter gangjinensis]APE29269.1 putative peptidoglycan lipid II flippase MurJ [Aurantiacibacter gangjinensis]KLE31128.1 virulence factor MviN [Aurantiacibacter gangjinensis]
MSLLKNVGTIGSLTMVSRVAGLAREMIFSRVLGANEVTDAWFQALIIPNVFRRLFAEGAFSAAFVPMFSKRLHAETNEAGETGLEQARSFSQDVISVFVPALILLTAIFQIAMPGVIRLLSDDDITPEKLDYSIDFARIMFPYILLVSVVTLLTGMLNSVSRFGPGASFPIIFNIVLIGALLYLQTSYGAEGDVLLKGYVVAWAIPVAGVLQLGWLLYWAHVEGFRPRWFTRPKVTPEVKRLGWIALPAAIGGGAYQINTLLQVYFLNQLEGSAVSWMNYADRLNQLPLGIIGIALSTAILPSLSKFVGANDRDGAARIQSNAIELGMLLTLPAAVALSICAVPFITMIFGGGRFDAEDAAMTGGVLAVLVAGLPAYVLVKVLVPSFYARSDTKTPVYAAFAALAVFIGFNIAFLQRFGVEGVAAASAIGAWLNCAILYVVLRVRGYYRLDWPLLGRLARQLLAAIAMGAALYYTRDLLTPLYDAGVLEQLAALAALVACAVIVYFGAAFALGAVSRQRIAIFMTKKDPTKS